MNAESKRTELPLTHPASVEGLRAALRAVEPPPEAVRAWKRSEFGKHVSWRNNSIDGR